MRNNVGGMDRGIRLVLGIALLALGLLHLVTGAWAVVAYVFGGVALVTSLVRYCPAWSAFGINTCSAEHK